MNARLAKGPFNERSMDDMMQDIYNQLFALGVSKDSIYRRCDHPPGQKGYYTAAAKNLRKILQEIGHDKNSQLSALVGSFTLAANVSELYIFGTLNMKEMVTHQNYELIEAQAKQNLSTLPRGERQRLLFVQRSIKRGRDHSLQKRRMIS